MGSITLQRCASGAHAHNGSRTTVTRALTLNMLSGNARATPRGSTRMYFLDAFGSGGEPVASVVAGGLARLAINARVTPGSIWET